MPRASTLDKLLSQADRDRLSALLDANPHMSLVDWQRELEERYGVAISRSAAHREKQKLERLGARLRRTRQMRQALFERIKDEDQSEHMRALAELIGDLGYEYVEARLEAEPGDLDPKQLQQLATMGEKLSVMLLRNQQFADAVRKRAMEEAAEVIDSTAEKMAAEPPMTVREAAAAFRLALKEL